jgi:ABC-type antimicrobial peptide transport system permease subunit
LAGTVFGWSAGFCLALYLLGFYISIPIFACAYLKLRRRSWLVAVIFAVALLAFSYAVFAIGLKVPLYKGLIFGAH